MLAVVGASSAHDAPSAAQWRLVDVPEQPSTKAHFAPTHLLDIRSSRSREHAVVPVHGLLFASCCRSLPFISSAPEQQPTLLSHANLPRTPRPASEHASRLLPVVPLSLPSVAAFSLVQRWIYHHDAAALLATLVSAATLGDLGTVLIRGETAWRAFLACRCRLVDTGRDGGATSEGGRGRATATRLHRP